MQDDFQNQMRNFMQNLYDGPPIPPPCEDKEYEATKDTKLPSTKDIQPLSVQEPPQNFNIFATILSTKEPEHSLSMGYEHHNITPETESDEVTESNAENLLPIPSEYDVTLEDEIECDMPAKDDNPSIPRPPLEPPDAETDAGEEILVVMNDKDEDVHYSSFMFDNVFSLLSAESEDTIFDP
nr:hypothetical protein [Tanacetum cinerariifolium]